MGGDMWPWGHVHARMVTCGPGGMTMNGDTAQGTRPSQDGDMWHGGMEGHVHVRTVTSSPGGCDHTGMVTRAQRDTSMP